MPTYSNIELDGFYVFETFSGSTTSNTTLSAVTSGDFTLTYSINAANTGFDLEVNSGTLHNLTANDIEIDDSFDPSIVTFFWGTGQATQMLLYIRDGVGFSEVLLFPLSGSVITDVDTFLATVSRAEIIESGPFAIDGAVSLSAVSGIRIDTSDAIEGNEFGNTLLGGDLADRIEGKRGEDTLSGLDGDDALFGGIGLDTLLGGRGNDILNGGSGGDTINGGAGIDTASYEGAGARVQASLTNANLNDGNARGDTYISIENIIGSDFNDQLQGDEGDNLIQGALGNDEIAGGAGQDRLEGGEGDDLLVGQEGDDQLYGGAGNDRLNGGMDDDLLQDGIGADMLTGETGDDQLEGGRGADQIDGGDGIDAASYVTARSGVALDLGLGIGTGGNANGDSFVSIENVIGSDFSDVITGSDEANHLFGGRAADVLNGGAGNDRLEGGDGPDALDGGEGSDTASYITAIRGVGLSLFDGEGFLNNANGDTYVSIENVIGSGFDDVITGDDLANALSGGRGDDILRGRRGDDTINGGRGNDTMYGGGGDDTFVFRANNGDDRLVAFNAAADSIRFAISGLEFSDLVFTERAGNAVIDYGSGTITLDGITQETAEELVFDFG